MRVKLSYTVEEEEVLAEAAKMLGLCGDHMQQAVGLFTAVQKVLRGDDTDTDRIDVGLALEMIDEYRKALFNVDTRLSEVVDIIQSYDDYQREQKRGAPPSEEDGLLKASDK